jgi:hypothetical protein
MRKLNGNVFEDDNKYFPSWQKKCVIPERHLPIFNKTNDNQPWDMLNYHPNPNSPSYMRLTTANEYPKGYVVDLTKHNEKTFKSSYKQATSCMIKNFLMKRNVWKMR